MKILRLVRVHYKLNYLLGDFLIARRDFVYLMTLTLTFSMTAVNFRLTLITSDVIGIVLNVYSLFIVTVLYEIKFIKNIIRT
jgi:hypothetical protein